MTSDPFPRAAALQSEFSMLVNQHFGKPTLRDHGYIAISTSKLKTIDWHEEKLSVAIAAKLSVDDSKSLGLVLLFAQECIKLPSAQNCATPKFLTRGDFEFIWMAMGGNQVL
jgi:hypothetical protein